MTFAVGFIMFFVGWAVGYKIFRSENEALEDLIRSLRRKIG